MENPSALMQACLELAQGAGAILRQRFSQPRTVDLKAVNDLVTDADKASEHFLIEEVRRRFPDHSILAEESGTRTQPGAKLIWVMDPLDGTTNYAHGFPHFNVSVAACPLGPGVALAGCVHDPMREESFVAAQGQGAWLIQGGTRNRLKVSGCAALSQSLLATGFPNDRARFSDNNHPEHDALSVRSHGVRRPGAAALDLAYVAAGRLDGYWEAHLHAWDLAAGALLVLEAGGVVTDYQGRAFDGTQTALVAATADLHAELQSVIASTRTQRGFSPTPQR